MEIDRPSQAQIPQLLALWKAAFGSHNGFWELFLGSGFSPERCRCITLEDQVAASLCWFDCSCQGQRIAYVYAVVTHPGYRGKGLCRELMTQVHTALAALGYQAVLLVPAEEALRSMYRKLGYRDCTSVSEFLCTAAEKGCPARSVGLEEYQQLRRTFLPEKGVLQEGENLDFLAAQAQLFAGEDFLLAAYLEKDTLQGMELLGNRAAAPGIVHSLGCKAGRFRTPGDTIPFAMIHTLTEAAVQPGYFGFAFD